MKTNYVVGARLRYSNSAVTLIPYRKNFDSKNFRRIWQMAFTLPKKYFAYYFRWTHAGFFEALNWPLGTDHVKLLSHYLQRKIKTQYNFIISQWIYKKLTMALRYLKILATPLFEGGCGSSLGCHSSDVSWRPKKKEKSHDLLATILYRIIITACKKLAALLF